MIAKLCALAAIMYLVSQLVYPLFKTVSRRQQKRTGMYLREKTNQNKKQYFSIFKKKITPYCKKLLSQSDKKRYEKIIQRLDLSIKPEDIRTDQILYTIGAILVTLFMFWVHLFIGCISALFIVLAWLYPVSEYEKTIDRKNKNIAQDFPSFYSMIYYQYTKSVNIFLADVIKDYIQNANEDMAEELGVMLDNIEYGEVHALKQLKKRIPLHYVIKFCDMMETRLKGYNNIAQMAYLKNEIDNFRVKSLEDELERRSRSNARIQFVLIVILLFYIAVYYFFTIIESLTLFQ